MKLNYFNFKRFDDKILLTNDAGKYIFLTQSEMTELLKKNLGQDDPVYKKLKECFFIYDEPIEMFSANMMDSIRGNKSYLFSATSLHIFVLTNECNMRCVYCQAQSLYNRTYGKMNNIIAKKAVDIALQSPSDYLVFEFQGGEPLINFDILKYIILYSEEYKGNKQIKYTIASNLLLISDEILAFLKQYNLSISTSLDGDMNLHDSNRVKMKNQGTYQATISAIKKVREYKIDVSAIQTTTRQTLNSYCEMIDTYIETNLKTIFIRPLTPLGFAQTSWDNIGYTSNEFIEFYDKTLKYIIQKNIEGDFIREGHATLFLKKILQGYSDNYMELRSPCGAVVGQLAYYYDGEIYTCDEGRMLAEMGDDAFHLGSVHNSSYDKIIESSVNKSVLASSLLESSPTCESCVYQPYCGTCPVINYAIYGDIISKHPNNYRCQIYRGILDILFNYIKIEDKKEMEVFYNWL